jgi:hypothetical protein
VGPDGRRYLVRPMSFSAQRWHDHVARWPISHCTSWSGAAAIWLRTALPRVSAFQRRKGTVRVTAYRSQIDEAAQRRGLAQGTAHLD